uniref:Translational activator of cytochrome c oxidase 1 n=1 Tax=Trichobilharzia regenti TaxID=157069 RepID=A0AA85JHH0_TRIRE|nr:unnamed protein product [Trichobilharzia regenti]
MNQIVFGLFSSRLLSSKHTNKYFLKAPVYLFGTKDYCLVTQFKRFAGHSHWQNVRHIKEAGDREKSKNAIYYIRAVQSAIRNGGGIRDPKLNTKLAAVLAEAKSKAVPFSTLEKQLSADNVIEPYLIELKAPGGLFVLVESRAKQVQSERQRIASLIKRFGCSVAPAGDIANQFFDHIGVITVSAKSNERLPNLDAATNLGIEIGANEVELRLDGEETYEFLCEVSEINKLRESLENIHQIPVLDSQDIYSPKVVVPVLQEVRETLDEMYEKIRNQHEYVERIFDNTTVKK